MVPVIAPDHSGNRKGFPMIWGFHVEGLERPIIKARVENAKDTDTFKESWQKHRCVIPASYYVDWSRIQSGGRIIPKDQYAVQPTGKVVTFFAGLYRIEEGYMGFRYPAFTILTRPATPDLKMIDARMPVMLDEADIDAWIRPDLHTVGSVFRDIFHIKNFFLSQRKKLFLFLYFLCLFKVQIGKEQPFLVIRND